MSILNIGPENHDYVVINENSTNVDKLNVVFKILQRSNGPEFIDYEKLFINHSERDIFDARLENTGLVIASKTKSISPTFRLNNIGILLLAEHKSFLNYIEQEERKKAIQKNKLEEKENLEMQKLRGEVMDLTNRLVDYESTKSRAIKSYWVATIAVLIALIS